MTARNYDSSQVGAPFVRAHRIEINYYDAGREPEVVVRQSLAVRLADGTVRQLEEIEAMQWTVPLSSAGADPIPLVSPEDGSALGADTSLNQVMLGILAVIRQRQTG